MCENGVRKGYSNKALMDGLCVLTKTNAWKTVLCECVWMEKVEQCLKIFWYRINTESGGWMEQCHGRMEHVRSVLTVSELNTSVTMQESLQGDKIESVEK